jgi:hypothetical protein
MGGAARSILAGSKLVASLAKWIRFCQLSAIDMGSYGYGIWGQVLTCNLRVRAILESCLGPYVSASSTGSIA